MKNNKFYFIVLLISLLSLKVSAQLSTDSLSIIKTSAVFMDDKTDSEFINFISRTLEYPQTNKKLNGRVLAQFVVDSLGNVTDVKILRSLREDYDKKVIEAIKKSPKWTPATENSKPIAEQKIMPVIFHK